MRGVHYLFLRMEVIIMAIIPWKPLGDLDKFFSDEDWFLPVAFRSNVPAMDVYETEKNIVAKLNLPGVDPEKINISIKDQVLRVSGASEEKTEEKKKGYWRREIRQGSFERAASLPQAVKEGAVEATYSKGVLEIVMPKAEAAKAAEKKIQVKVKKS